jgi:hypothetical protein
MVLDVEFMAALDEHDAGAHPPRVGDDGPGSHAKCLGLVTGSDAAGRVGEHGHDANRLAA